MINKTIQYDFDDLLIEPAFISNITSRSQVNPRYGNMLPLFTAPMDTVISEENFDYYRRNGINPIIPRKKDVSDGYVSSGMMYSYSLEQIEQVFLRNKKTKNDNPFNVLIDVANGHMSSLIEVTKKLKEMYGNKICLMVGNIANPITIDTFCKLKVDYVRLSVGSGSSCLSSQNVAVGSTLPHLIDECFKIRSKFYDNHTKLVADGGFKNYSDIIKALALGADYVMLGGILNKSLESCAITTKNGEVINQYKQEAIDMFNSGIPLIKEFRGMSTKEVQKSLGKEKLTTSEGIVTKNKVEYLLSGWVENFEDYLKSAMSYTDSLTLEDFKGRVTLNLISQNAFKRFNK